ncbi:MAG: calcium-binding protein [Rhodobacteraceae bacterium]|nr:calcium-binding protein [Paracoccaceae bacterium]
MKRTTLFTAAALIAVASTAVVATAYDRGQRDGNGPGEGRGGPVMLLERFDANGDGAVTLEEMQGAAAARFTEADTNGDGMLSAEEMAAAADAQRAKRQANRIARRIERHDTDGDGMLSLEEVTAAAEGRNFAKMFERFDADGDGTISQAELEAAQEQGSGRGHWGKGGGSGWNN